MNVEPVQLLPDAAVPNHPAWPVLIYRAVIPPTRDMAAGDDLAAAFEDLFNDNGWGECWRDGIFPYHHFHPRAHEVLGFARGRATVQIGGVSGPVVDFATGDVVVLPAGTGHCRLSATGDLMVVGAYPEGQDPLVMRANGGDPALLAAQVKRVARPACDPVEGRDGTLRRLWG